MGTTAAAPVRSTAGQRAERLYFERDAAGFNNCRLGFESCVVLAALTKRVLVLPAPTSIQHTDGKFHELLVWCATSLAGVIRFESGSDEQTKCPAGAQPWTRSLVDFVRDQPQGDIWINNNGSSRIQHFECLQLSPPDAKRAATAMLGVTFQPVYYEYMKLLLKNASLEDYDGLHLRRGDFKSFRPNGYYTGADLLRRIRKRLGDDGTLVVATDDGTAIKELARGLPEKRVVSLPDLRLPSKLGIFPVVVDMLVMSRAKRFVGTEASTFSRGICSIRNRERVMKHERAEQFVSLEVEGTNDTRGACWNRCTTFDALR